VLLPQWESGEDDEQGYLAKKFVVFTLWRASGSFEVVRGWCCGH